MGGSPARSFHVRHFMDRIPADRRGCAGLHRAEGTARGDAHHGAVDAPYTQHGCRLPGPIPGSDARSRNGRPEKAGRRHRARHQELRSAQGRALRSRSHGKGHPGVAGPAAAFDHVNGIGWRRGAFGRYCPIAEAAAELHETDAVAAVTGPVAPDAAERSEIEAPALEASAAAHENDVVAAAASTVAPEAVETAAEPDSTRRAG